MASIEQRLCHVCRRPERNVCDYY